ncbi:MAG: hypothetical protein PHD01_12650 [Geobacteraceae bacterium]|nr:hypothetical protein [Geobacteraceae bacterium]
MLQRIMLLIIVIALLGGCESMKKKHIAWELDECSKSYNGMIRWHELDKAAAVFSPKELQEEFMRKADSAKGVKVTDFRIKKMECSPEKGEATVILDIDYYREPSVTVKTIEDKQEWKYVGKKENKKWQLMTLPPDFP